ncbi:MAG: hypothetical protein ACK4UL_04605 [Novosphingobium meiothermophilum]|uniref:hypothetical protein n=1 Tax=Novosphingobium meiothermophilum TaxID=2202251 RepID=UPI000D6E76A3|nr:hypothetical protein [Novosphingobium meiothermophilum]
MTVIWALRILTAAILAFALRKGDEPERLVAAILIATIVLDILNHAMFGFTEFFVVNPGHLVIDGWGALALLWVALRANRGWPMLVSAAQIIVVLGHLAKIIDLSLVRFGYFAMTQLPIAIQAMALFAGTWAHMRREERIGRYRGWRLA